jgi:hypothetical protein
MDRRSIIEPTIKRRPQEQADFFNKIIDTVAKDPRTETIANKVYLTLKETVLILPAYLSEREFVEILFDLSIYIAPILTRSSSAQNSWSIRQR